MHHGSWTLDRRQFVRCVLIALAVCTIAYASGLCVNCGPSMDGLGWAYVTAWGVTPDHTGQIMRFAPAGRPAWTRFLPRCTEIKRVVGLDSEGRLIYEGDSSELSADCRDDLPPVPPENVAGVVVAAVSPARLLRSLTPEGRLRNRVDFCFGPKQRVQCGDRYLTWDSRGLWEVGLDGSRPVDPWDERLDDLLEAGGGHAYRLLGRALADRNLLEASVDVGPCFDATERLSHKVHVRRGSPLLVLISVNRRAEFALGRSAQDHPVVLATGWHLLRLRAEDTDPELHIRPLGSPGRDASALLVALITQERPIRMEATRENLHHDRS